MGKYRDPFWGGYKEIIRRYGSYSGVDAQDISEEQKAAVRAAVEVTERLPDGRGRMQMIDMVFWRQTHTLEGAAQQVGYSDRTVRRWHTEFIRLVAEKLMP